LASRLRFEIIPATKSTPRVAARVVPLYEPEIVAEVEMSTIDVLTVKDALLTPAGTITPEGTLAAPLLLKKRDDCAACGSGSGQGYCCRWTIAARQTTLEGLSVKEERVSGGSGNRRHGERGRSRHANRKLQKC